MKHQVQPELEPLLVPVEQLNLYFRNPRIGDVEQIRTSLRRNGQYKAIVVNRGTQTGRPDEVLAGNHTLIAMRDEEWTHCAATWVDVDEATAARIVAVDNRLNDIADYDNAVLAELLHSLGEDLEGSGYDVAALEDLDIALAGKPPDLDELARDYGEAAERDTWPSVVVRCPPMTRNRFNGLMDEAGAGEEHERFAALLDAAAKVLGEPDLSDARDDALPDPAVA